MQKKEAVLVVADSPIIGEYFSSILGECGYRAIIALSATTAKEVIGPDIAILIAEITMPGTHGQTLVQEVASTHPDIQIIVYSCHDSLIRVVAPLTAGAFKHLPPPNRNSGIRTAVQQSLEKIRSQKEICSYISTLEQLAGDLSHALNKQRKDYEDLNIALNVLLKKMERDKNETKQQIMVNLEELIIPYIKKIEQTRLDQRQKLFVETLKKNLGEIASPFTYQLSFSGANLSSSEIKVANLAWQGRSIKEIADVMNLAPDTIKTHRKKIRKKLGIANTTKSLQTALANITEMTSL